VEVAEALEQASLTDRNSRLLRDLQYNTLTGEYPASLVRAGRLMTRKRTQSHTLVTARVNNSAVPTVVEPGQPPKPAAGFPWRFLGLLSVV
jgi:hypothetical protein